MKHAGPQAKERLATLANELRALPQLKEKSEAVFYWKSKAFLHFHEDEDRLFADVRLAGPEFDRFEVTTEAQQATLLRKIKRAIG